MKLTLAALLLSIAFIIPALVFAQTVAQPSGTVAQPTGSCSGTNCSYSVNNPLGANSFCGLVQNLLQAALAIGIPIAVLFIVYAGFKFVLAQGNPEKLKEARNNFMWTVIGIAIFLGAWLLASVVANTVNALGSGSGASNIISCN